MYQDRVQGGDRHRLRLAFLALYRGIYRSDPLPLCFGGRPWRLSGSLQDPSTGTTDPAWRLIPNLGSPWLLTKPDPTDRPLERDSMGQRKDAPMGQQWDTVKRPRWIGETAGGSTRRGASWGLGGTFVRQMRLPAACETAGSAVLSDTPGGSTRRAASWGLSSALDPDTLRTWTTPPTACRRSTAPAVELAPEREDPALPRSFGPRTANPAADAGCTVG
jgi:hypothetical protein